MNTPLVTAEELEHLSFPDKTVELVRGHLVVREPPGTWHGAVSMELGVKLSTYVRQHNLGLVFGQDTGFKIASSPDTVRGPDVAFVARERLGAIQTRGFAALAPDLLAEIVSPDDRPGELLKKVGEWLSAGSRLVWVIDPLRNTARVYRPDGSVSVLGLEDSLDGEDVVPGFACGLREILTR
ncbi:MAG: Uma2 family endonuclease [Gemmatimonadetes bacterium]|nr:Uma2 family endonuclease [Gemmatimonadota bacterium]